MYANGPETLTELDAHYPKRPRNHAPTMPFAELFKQLFNPLTRNTGSNPAAKARRGASKTMSPSEQRRITIETFFSNWRNKVGNDVFPAMRLVLPDSDRDRSVYRLKEQTIAKLLIKLMKISPKSEDGHSLLNWKVPGKSASSRLAGDFAGRCYEALKKRPLKTDPGEMRIGEVNVMLDKLAAVSGEADQLPIFEEFYARMNPEELQWLIRIILKQMKIGATERTMLNAWHKDAEKLFNVSSNLRHVCWELWDPSVTLEEEKSKLSLMSPFQPQLARYPMPTTEKTIQKLGLPDNNREFYIEEKLDGERMQLHMHEDNGVFKFGFWSRKGKNYTYLYGESFEDQSSALTRHLEGVFHEGVRSCILDGEMIAWDPSMNKMLAFGTLKTAALNMQNNPFDKQGWRPLFRVFDCLYFNGNDLTNLILRERRRVLNSIIVKEIPGRFERHPYKEATTSKEIEDTLREIVANSSEGLIIKNPHSVYELNRRPDSWVKVKPEYMTEYGENLDCVIIGGYYGSGHRGGIKSSFMCGLRASQADVEAGLAGPETFYSFFKVGGGLRAEDYAEIEHYTDGKWEEWTPRAANRYVVLAGGDRYHEKPDVWIRPSDSVVIEVKAASAEKTNSFRVGQTLRFPRFRRIRHDKQWDNGALDMDEWENLERKVEEELKETREMEMEEKRRKTRKRQKRELTVAGEAQFITPVAVKSKLFEGKTFYLTGGSQNPKKPQEELEKLIKEHGGVCTKNPASVRDGHAIPLADRQTARALAIQNMEGVNIFTPKWALDCIRQNHIVPFETEHLHAATDDMYALAAENSDQYGDSYFRDVDVDELRATFERMKEGRESASAAAGEFNVEAFYNQLEAQGHELPRSRGYVFRRCRVFFAPVDGVSELTMARLRSFVGFGNGRVIEDLDEHQEEEEEEEEVVTHVVVVGRDPGTESATEVAARIRKRLSERASMKIPRVVTKKWVEDCWKEETRVSEEDYAVL